MKALANYAMRGRLQAMMLSSAFAVLSMILPPLSYISGAVVSLVTMRRGLQDGALIALGATAALAAVSLISAGNIVVAMVFALLVWLPVWILSAVLRKTVSLPFTLSVATLMVMLGVAVFHGATGDVVAWWGDVLEKVFAEALRQPGMSNMGMILDNAPQFMTVLMATAFFVSLILSLFLARWWQAALYNPGGFQKEFHAFRLDKSTATLGMTVILFAIVSASPGQLVYDLAIVVGIFASISGVSLVHHWVAETEANKGWLILMYLLLAFVAPQILLVLAILGFADAWLSIRRFYAKPAE
ncbi:MAG TPA: DUF2232 domain-containing protein [Gammaproteobacteria bacterium]|nr:DUF2232 domain-containing protein [Gammaproteobacteria bacterium]